MKNIFPVLFFLTVAVFVGTISSDADADANEVSTPATSSKAPAPTSSENDLFKTCKSDIQTSCKNESSNDANVSTVTQKKSRSRAPSRIINCLIENESTLQNANCKAKVADIEKHKGP